jgi:hypothetical protein
VHWVDPVVRSIDKDFSCAIGWFDRPQCSRCLRGIALDEHDVHIEPFAQPRRKTPYPVNKIQINQSSSTLERFRLATATVANDDSGMSDKRNIFRNQLGW